MAKGTKTNPGQLPSIPSTGVYNSSAPSLANGDQTSLQLDSSGNLKVAVAGSGSTTDVNIEDISGNPVAIGNPLPVELSDGTNPLGTDANPLRVDPTGVTAQPVEITGYVGGVLDAVVGAAAPANAIQVGGSDGTDLRALTMLNTAPVGTEYASVVRPITRAYGQILTTSLLAANAVYTSSWFDTNLSGATTISTSVYANPGGTIAIQQSSDITNANFTATVLSNGVATNTLVQQNATIIQRYWRIQYTNSGTNQSSFELSAKESDIPTVLQISGGTSTYQVYSAGIAIPVGFLGQGGITEGSATYAPVSPAATASAIPVASLVFTSGANSSTVFLRTPNIFKTAQATASGNTALWTPASGKKFRMMRLNVQVTANAYLDAGAGTLTVTFQDSATGINVAFDIYLPAASVSAPLGDAYNSGWIDLGNGILSAAANNVLNINLSGKVDSGNVRVNVCGTEE